MTRAHGTRAKYVIDKCRCDACRQASTEAQRAARARVEPAYIAAAPVRQHIRDLQAHGLGLKTIARQSGVSHGAISRLMYGTKDRAPSKRVRPETAAKILAVLPSDAADGAIVDAAPTWDIINRLLARGWTKTAIARQIGQQGPGLQLGRRQISHRHARTIKSLLDLPVPARRTSRGTTYQPPAIEEPEPIDDRDQFLAAMAELLEERVEQRHWRSKAACIGRPLWLFFPGRGDGKTLAAARKVCASCIVRRDCETAHSTIRGPGVYAGLTERQRRARRSEPDAEEVA